MTEQGKNILKGWLDVFGQLLTRKPSPSLQTPKEPLPQALSGPHLQPFVKCGYYLCSLDT